MKLGITSRVFLMIVAVVLVIAFVSLQLFLSFRIQMESEPSATYSSVYQEYDTTIVPKEVEELIQPEETIEIHPTAIPETVSPTKEEHFFNPAGISFAKPKWYSLYRYYQQMKEKEAKENDHSLKKSLLKQIDPSLPYQVIQTPFYKIMFIQQGCVDVYKRSILIIQSNSSTSTKSHLRPYLFTSPRKSVKVDGFDDYSLYTVNGTIPSSVPVVFSNGTWILTTPQEVVGDECSQSFSQYIPLFYESVYSILPQSPESIILPFYPVSRRQLCSKLVFEIGHFSLLHSPMLQYGKLFRSQLSSNGFICYNNIILTTTLLSHNTTFPLPIHYDCFRAAAYKYFNIHPRYSLSVTNSSVEGSLVLTFLYSSKPSLDLKSVAKESFTSLPIRSREYSFEERSMREIVALYCNSDVVVQWGQTSYFALFLLPYNGLIVVEDEVPILQNRVLYYSVRENELTTVLKQAIADVVDKKYHLGD